ncbi:hypothetical protein BVRB_4g096840 [Beta vulgaris subsp. vulgaris]|uniref:Uncharacterized protein n=1 Tax=Beta vulgaris subsp. vulgaris TaxID=3555 RepID=A0A0J8E4B8_BETVV|nr:hypothetical protein BVRB_4g096840 [Beta vulgaris subsp. vulgaris]
MAAAQQSQGVVEFNDKEKVAIAEAINEAQNQLASNNAKASQEQLVLVAGTMKNVQVRPLMLSKTHDWEGHFVASPPERLPGAGSTSAGSTIGAFIHEGATSLGSGPIVLPMVVGSKAAIVYDTFDKMYPGLGYLLAWYKPENHANGISKVYVEAGNSSRLRKMDWKEIEEKLDASGSRSRYWDSDTGAAAAAEIKNHGEKAALIGAMFDRFQE